MLGYSASHLLLLLASAGVGGAHAFNVTSATGFSVPPIILASEIGRPSLRFFLFGRLIVPGTRRMRSIFHALSPPKRFFRVRHAFD